MSDTSTATRGAPRDRWYRRAAATGHWVRDTGLGAFGVALLVLVAAAGWGGSTIGLHDFAVAHMDYTGVSAWLVPATFDGASVGLSIAAFRAAIHGRGAPLTRVGIAAFTSLSSWMNYQHIEDPTGRRVAALLPIAGVTLLEALLSEARRAYSRRHGHQQRPRIHPMRIAFDWTGTWAILRSIVLAVPVPGANTPPAATVPAPRRDTDIPPDVSGIDAATRGAVVTPIHRSPGSGGSKQEAMRAVFDRYVSEGRAADLTGQILADAAGANASLGRRYLQQWRAELADTVRDTEAATTGGSR